MTATHDSPRVGLFVTCLVDVFRPSVGFASVRLLEAAGCRVEVPASQTCCGQPAFNSGDRVDSRAFARGVIEAFDGYDYVVGPSGSCIGMLHHYPELFDDDSDWRKRASALAGRAFELTSFLVDVMGVGSVRHASMAVSPITMAVPDCANWASNCASLLLKKRRNSLQVRKVLQP